MKNTTRYGCWLIDNIKFSGDSFKTTIHFNGRNIEILVTNYENSKKLPEPLNKWIHQRIINNNPTSIYSIFIITTNGYETDNSSYFTEIFRLSLKLVFFKPIEISNTYELINNIIAPIPNKNILTENRMISKKEINSITFEKVIDYFNVLSKFKKKHIALHEIYKITEINDTILELLCLYSFIEGFWHNKRGTSNIINSFEAMLKQDFAPGRENKIVREKIKNKIKTQNGLFREPKLNEMRTILAHGIYKQEELSWTEKHWKTLSEQRDLLIELIIESLVNREKT
ncbi:hypothetical protein [Tenacibaculum piscium]|uniref:Apea-like HEPN domain-containing protein n=1 Tax=Tenacibaculum piscium TaxID=1458515 RepID=A0A2H1YH43_9FLAO|nr:hypothetical protein [Tenacibaculum piscium]MBE7630485.1 hypothetical protein [Tenacibaculum piscium]MBE7671635.1 hypothetical protein [Tenacibaculum piscium]SOS74783.1 conserved hypothetical protein [Tenacibaculum piscium]